MQDVVIRAEGLGKKYVIGHETQPEYYVSLRDVITRGAQNFLRKARDMVHGRAIVEGDELEEVWALRDVSFEIGSGEVVGVIGRNGAGKSTLLKILSRITDPSEGRVTVKGRVASLLEIGTGFHPELTGRENVYLNGAILGMARAEINRKFDEIVSFAAIERFLDTPVKRYSSGMYARLAFAVAAHLDPEILVVDEVLSVGDAEFQKKCLGKMENVARNDGRTVLFVSHNMQAVQSLCSRSVLLEEGRIVAEGDTRHVVMQYLSRACSSTGERSWHEHDAPGNAEFRLTAVRLGSTTARQTGAVTSKDDLLVEFDFIADTANPGLCVGFDVVDSEGTVVFRTYQTDLPLRQWPVLKRGRNSWRCTIPKGLFNGGIYYLSPRIGIHNVHWIVNLDSVLSFEVLLDHGDSPLWNSLTGTSRPGLIAPILQWESI